jgi:TPR repeat protein
MSDELPDAVLAEIRRAAFELRRTDPEEAVRVLRRVAEQGGAAAVLAHGALAEIYLDEYGDLDGAEHEFREVLKAAPQLPAAELGLARVLREQGRLAEADQGLTRALAGFERAAVSLRDGQQRGEPLPPGAEEEVLGLLEVAVELAELRHRRGKNGSVRVELDESLLGWAIQQRLFDAVREEQEAGEADPEDWIRFHAHWTQLRVLTGRASEAAASLREAEERGQLPPQTAARLRSDALEESDDLDAAAKEAARALELGRALGEPIDPDEVLRAAALLSAAGDDASADAQLSRALPEVDALAAAEENAEEKALLLEGARRLRAALEEPRGTGQERLVALGKRLKRDPGDTR